MKSFLTFPYSFRTSIAFALPVFAGFAMMASASTATPGGETVVPQRSGEVELPFWEVGESREGFDIRIWPEEVVLWLEQENLRDLISDPETPEEEKASLRQILAQQLAWKTT